MRLPEWSEDDSAALRKFMASDTGLRIGTMLRGLICDTAFQATSTPDGNLHWRCGYAAGVRATAQALDEWAKWHDEKVKTTDNRPTDDLTWLHGNDSAN